MTLLKKTEFFFIKKEILNHFKKDLRLCLFTLSNLILNIDKNNLGPYILDDLVEKKVHIKLLPYPA